MKVLFVCLGNICRSPLAEAIFVEKIKQRGLQNSFQADSCGTSTYNLGDDPDPRTIKSARKNNVPIHHIARQLRRSDFDDFDVILAMDRNNFQNILAVGGEAHATKVMLMRSYDPQGNGDVPDPYYGNEKDFDEVFDILNRSVEKLIDEISSAK